MNRLRLIILFLIILLAFTLRIYNLGKNPAGFFADEAATGYNAYTILVHGTDEYGQPFPLLFPSFGNNRLPIPIYFTVPFVGIFGLNEFSTRLPSAVIGVLTIITVFLLLNRLYPNYKYIGLYGAYIMAISPWSIHFSRNGTENIYLPFLLLLGVYLFVKGIYGEKKFLFMSFFVLALDLYTYFPAYLIAPLTICILLITYAKHLRQMKKQIALGICIFLITTAPLIAFLFNGKALARWNNGVSILTSYHTPRETVGKFLYTYTSSFSIDYLFKLGDIDYPGQAVQRYSVKGMGMLYWFEFPLILAALVSIVLRRNKSSLLLVGLLLIYPLGSALTNNLNPFATRSILGSGIWPMISALGLVTILKFLEKYKKLFIISIIIFIIASLSFFLSYLYKYYYEYPLYSSGFWGWQYGPRDIMKYFLVNKNKYDEMYMVGAFNGSEIFLKFYDPQNSCMSKCAIGDIDRFSPQKRQLFTIEPNRIYNLRGLSLDIKKTIFYPNKQPAFYIAELHE